MYIIAKEKGGFRAIPIGPETRWDFRKVYAGKREIRIILRVSGRQYTLYTTHGLAEQHPAIDRDRLDTLCDDLIVMASEAIRSGHRYSDFTVLTAIVETGHRRNWFSSGLIKPSTAEECYGHTVDPKVEILIDRDSPVTCDQEDLPY